MLNHKSYLKITFVRSQVPIPVRPRGGEGSKNPSIKWTSFLVWTSYKLERERRIQCDGEKVSAVCCLSRNNQFQFRSLLQSLLTCCADITVGRSPLGIPLNSVKLKLAQIKHWIHKDNNNLITFDKNQDITSSIRL